jgi:cold shock protein
MSDRVTGVVKWFNAAKGYGFIQLDGGGEDVFVHYRAIKGDGFRTLKDGQRVELVVKKGDKGLQAEEVTLIE